MSNGEIEIRNLKIVKVPRKGYTPDIPIAFPPLDNLHLDLLEVKKKIKPGLPLIPIKQRKPVHPPSPRTDFGKNRPESITVGGSDSGSHPASEIESEAESHHRRKSKADRIREKYGARKHKPKAKAIVIEEDEEDLVDALGSDNDSDEEDEDGSDVEIDSDEEEDEGEEEEEEDDPYAGLSPEEREAKEKEEYLWRFRILKKKYKNTGMTNDIQIPEFNEHSNLDMMKTSYERTIKELYLEDSVETYRTYLVGGFIITEFIATQWIGVDLSGFTVQQTRMMYKYDRLLIELGEKSYTQWGGNLPVEVRLVGMILIQAGIFYLGKVISQRFGNSVSDLFKGMTGQPPEPTPQPQASSSQSSPQPSSTTSKMRGPRIRVDDIREMRGGGRKEEE